MRNWWSDPAFYGAVLWEAYIPIIAFGWGLIWLRSRRLNVYLVPLLMFGWALFVVWLLGVVTRWGEAS
jgi:hypothetical protein